LAATNKDNSSSGIVGISMIGSNTNPNNGAMFESYLVGALKKQNRELRHELDEKTQTVDKLKRDVKLTRTSEIEIELQAYIEECQRMRTMME
jgi:hypothetical protein